MRLRSNLFLKLFLGFWVIMLITLIGSVLVERSISLRDEFSIDHQQDPDHLRGIRHILYDIRELPLNDLEQKLETLRRKQGMRIVLIAEDGKELFGHSLSERDKRIAKQLRNERRRIVRRTPRGRLFAYTLYRPDTGLVRAVITTHPPPPSFVRALTQHLWMRLGLAMLISGLLCYGLSHLLTRRIRYLREAVQTMTTGILDKPLDVRQFAADETDDLAQDFNNMATQLQERIDAYQRLLLDVSHELRSPLARLQLALALAQEDRNKIDQHLQRIEMEANHLDNMIAQLLTQPDAHSELDTHIDLVALLQALCDEAQFEGADAEKTITLDCPVATAPIATSGDLLYAAIGNVIRNAINYTASNSTVTVRLNTSLGQYIIEVDDCGSGVPEAELPRMFDAFYRVDSARARETGGYGLGLAIAKRAIARHGGSIKAQNTDTGLRVIICLPQDSSENE